MTHLCKVILGLGPPLLFLKSFGPMSLKSALSIFNMLLVNKKYFNHCCFKISNSRYNQIYFNSYLLRFRYPEEYFSLFWNRFFKALDGVQWIGCSGWGAVNGMQWMGCMNLPIPVIAYFINTLDSQSYFKVGELF